MKLSKSQTKLLNNIAYHYSLPALKVEYGVIYEGYEIASDIYDALYLWNSNNPRFAYSQTIKKDLRLIFKKLEKEMRSSN